MAGLSPHAPLVLLAWTDPTVVGAVTAGLAVLAIAAAWLLRSRSRRQDASPTEPSAPQPQPGTEQVGAAEDGDHGHGADTGADEAPPEPASRNLAAGQGRSLAELAAHEEVEDTELISRFVLDASGERLGETMTIDDGEVILKRDGDFFSVAPDAIIEKDGTLLADANIDWDEAREAGKAWEDANLDRMQYDEEGMPVKG